MGFQNIKKLLKSDEQNLNYRHLNSCTVNKLCMYILNIACRKYFYLVGPLFVGAANPSLAPPRFHQTHSSSSDSDTPTEGGSSLALSPEGFLEAPTHESRVEAKERRRYL